MLTEELKSPDFDRSREAVDLARPVLAVGSGITLLLGGARSGKSDLAVSAALPWAGPTVFVATAQAHDDDMASRISAHKVDRPQSWGLVEAPQVSAVDISEIDDSALIILDCLTLLVSNLMIDGMSEFDIVAQVDELAAQLASRRSPVLIISNEVGLGVHPATKLGGQYRDTLGRVNAVVARRASMVGLVMAGRVLPLADLQLRVEANDGRSCSERNE